MKTSTAARTTAASAKQRPSGKSGSSKPGKITVTIDGALADELRKEAEGTGMGALSLVRQRIKLGSLLTQDSDEARRFRMDVAEKTFREAGIESVPDRVPANLGRARVTLDDALWIKSRAMPIIGSDPWIVAGVFAVIGNEALGNEDAAEKVNADCNKLLWEAIFRDERHFTEEIPVFVTEGALEEMAQTAAKLRRDLPDFLGTAINLGIRIFQAGRGLEFLTDHYQFELLARSAELEFVKGSNGEGGGE